MPVNPKQFIRECVREVLMENLSETAAPHPHQKTKKDIYALLAKAGFRPEGSQPREYMEYYLNGFATVFCMVRLDPNENEVLIQRYYDSERLDSMKGYHIEKSIPLPEAYTEEFVKEVVKECLRLQRSIRGDESIYGGMDDVAEGFDPQSQGPNPVDDTGNPYAKWNADMQKMEENEFDGKKLPKHNAKISPQEEQEANEVAKKIWGDELKNITFHSKSLNGRQTFFKVDTNSTYYRWLNKNEQGKWYYTDDGGIRSKWVPFESVNESDGSICGTCNGSGEGMADGTKCLSCGGSGDSEHPWGKRRRERDPDDERDSRIDHKREWGGMDEGIELTPTGGEDDWSRPIYTDQNGKIYVDINLGKGEPSIHSVTDQGEPEVPIKNFKLVGSTSTNKHPNALCPRCKNSKPELMKKTADGTMSCTYCHWQENPGEPYHDPKDTWQNAKRQPDPDMSHYMGDGDRT